MVRVVVIAAIMVATVGSAEAYIGPGVGAGAFAAVAAVVASVAVAFFALLWYPAKRLFRRKKTSRPVDPATDGGSAGEGAGSR